MGCSVFKYLHLIKDELLIVLGTSSSETVFPRVLTKLEAVGLEVPWLDWSFLPVVHCIREISNLNR